MDVVKCSLLLYQHRKDAVCNSGRQHLLIVTDLQVKRNTVLFNINYIVFMAICSLAQYQPQMIAEFVMTHKAEVSLVFKVEYSDARNAGSLLNVVMHPLHHLWQVTVCASAAHGKDNTTPFSCSLS